MAAIVRVKRRRDEEAANSLVLLCKKQKLDDGAAPDAENVETVFKFAGTISGKESAVTQCVKQAISKEKLENEYKRHTVSMQQDKRLQQRKNRAIDSRYKVFASRRALDLTSLGDDAVPTVSDAVKPGEKFFCLYDVEKDDLHSQKVPESETVLCNGVPMIRERVVGPPAPHASSAISSATDGSDVDFVYDLYYMNNAKFDFRALENILSIEAYREEFVYDGSHSDDDEVVDDDDDENAESHCRNDYPDEDPHYIDSPPRLADDVYENDGNEYGIYSDDEDDDLKSSFKKRLNLQDSDDEEREHLQDHNQSSYFSANSTKPQVITKLYRAMKDD